MKDNADYHVAKVLMDKTKKKNATGVLKEQYITVAVKQNGIVTERFKLRRITFKTQEGKLYVFITNNFTLPASLVATIYKNRWIIELLFKQVKQNFPLRYYWGNSTNAIKMRVYCVLDGGDKKESSNKVIVCQNDHSNNAASDELCRFTGIYKRYL